jgi:hypothetical protein
MGNSTSTPADPTRGTRNTVHDGATEGGRSPAEKARPPENAGPLPRGRPTAREALAALLDAPDAPSATTFANSPRLAELLARYHLGLIAPKAAARLGMIFEADPPDALARLERACDHLGVSGERADELVHRAALANLEAQGCTPARQHAATPTSQPANPPIPGDTNPNRHEVPE